MEAIIVSVVMSTGVVIQALIGSRRGKRLEGAIGTVNGGGTVAEMSELTLEKARLIESTLQNLSSSVHGLWLWAADHGEQDRLHRESDKELHETLVEYIQQGKGQAWSVTPRK